MKKVFITFSVVILALILSVNTVFADSITAPVVSIGIGNGNSPENTGPVSGNTYTDEIKVYATATDTNLDNYHFRVIKNGDLDGYTCSGEHALFLAANQGYASTTLGKTACGFVFNQSLYTLPGGFTNTLIAVLHAQDIVAFSGEGEYWLIMGAVDSSGNRTNANHLSDPRVKIVVSVPQASTTGNTSGGNTTESTPVATPVVSAGNGPIVNSFGAVSSGYSPASVVSPQTFTLPTSNVSNSSNGNVITVNTDTSSFETLADGGLNGGTLNSEILEETKEVSLSTTSDSKDTASTSQVAQAISSGFSSNWLWLIVLAIVLGGGYYYFVKKD